MSVRFKQGVIAVLGLVFLASLVLVQQREVVRRQEEAGLRRPPIVPPASSAQCVDCHRKLTPGIIDHWADSTHAVKGVGCVECHKADRADADAFEHYGAQIATIVTPRDCGGCHPKEAQEFAGSHHARGGNILASLDNLLAEVVEGSRAPFNPHSPTPSMAVEQVNGMASAQTGCQQCHGSKVALEGLDGQPITFEQLQPGPDGRPTNAEAVAQIRRDEVTHQPILTSASWPNTGIGRLNLDGSLGSCSACHSRHDFSPRRARQPENCAKCHLGPDHPQKEIYDESKHGVAFRDLLLHMNLDAPEWVLGRDYTQAPTCATCHMSANLQNGGQVTHDAGQRISWTNRPPVSALLDTDEHGELVRATDPAERAALTVDTWQQKRERMQQVCTHCHTKPYVAAFYQQYDDFILNYNEKFAKPGQQLMQTLRAQGLLTPGEFDEEIEWTWFYLWHHEGRRARHGASMMAPDYAHWHGMYEVAERFYMELIPQARELAEAAEQRGQHDQAEAVRQYLAGLLARPEHAWFESQRAAGPGLIEPPAPPPGAPPPDALPDALPEGEAPAGETPPGDEAPGDEPPPELIVPPDDQTSLRLPEGAAALLHVQPQGPLAELLLPLR